MRFALLVALGATAAVAQVPDGARPKIVPAVPLTPEEEARREALTQFGVGRMRQVSDRLADAAKHLQASAEREPTSPEPHRELAKVYAALGRDPAAIRAARKTLDLDPKDGEIAELLGKLLFDGRKFAESGKAYRQAADSPTFAELPAVRYRCLTRAAAAFEKAGDWPAVEDAVRAALKAIADGRAALLADNTHAELAGLRADLYERLGTALLRQKKTDVATAAFETARDICADPKQANDKSGVVRLHKHLAEVYAAGGKNAEAVAELQKYLAFKPSGLASYIRFAELLRLANPRADTAAVLSKLSTENPANPAPRRVAAAELARTDFAAAHRLFSDLAKTTTVPDGFPLLVAAYAKGNKPKELLTLIDAIYSAARPGGTEENPTSPKAVAVERARQLTAAVKDAPQLTAGFVRQLGQDVDAGTCLCFEVFELVTGMAGQHGLLDDMTDVLKGAAKKNPARDTDRRLNWLLFEAYTTQKRWRELAAAANELSDIGGNKIDLAAASQAAIAYAEMGEERKATDALKGIQGRLYVRLQTVRVWNILGKHKEALAECEEIMAKDRPRGADLRSVRVSYATALNHLKEHDKAETELRAILEDDPDDVLALNNLGYNLADQGRKLPEAEALIRRAMELDRDDRLKRGTPEALSGTYLDSLAWVLFRRGKLEEAKALFQKVVSTPDAGHDAIVWDHYGDVLFRLGDKAKAKTAWEKAAGLYADSHQGRLEGRLDELRRKLGLVK